jgi:hypothetical protein
MYIYPLSRIHNASLISAYFGLDSRDCKCLEYLFTIYLFTEKGCSLNANIIASAILLLLEAWFTRDVGLF